VRRIRNKHTRALPLKGGKRSSAFDAMTTTKRIAMWDEFDNILATMWQLEQENLFKEIHETENSKRCDEVDTDQLFWFEAETRMYDV
jgi:hypothetical protein